MLFGTLAYSQVGINTQSPKATLDVMAKTTDGSAPEGFIAPRLRGDEIQSADAMYTTSQSGTIVYATTMASSPSAKTINITAPGYYYFDGNIWQKMSGGGTGGTYTGSTSVALNGTSFERAALTGDVTATVNDNNTKVEKIQGVAVSSTAPTDAQFLRYNSTTSQWEPYTLTTPTLNVTTELTGNYTLGSTDDIVLFNNPAPATLTLPTSGVTIGRHIYVSSIGQSIDFAPVNVIRNTTFNLLQAGTSATLLYVGGGKWDVMTGY
ncbi:hypothetical protein [Chryseobacterium cucumeris]|uniref:hypothetical protein n=1 Tax=Chryseobacterium cucumeris TaxID=1813611 RepID=UPI0023F57D39|nr:hypothetical protein [Chryseobacterium cucumeris]